jgi:hypothetical protein
MAHTLARTPLSAAFGCAFLYVGSALAQPADGFRLSPPDPGQLIPGGFPIVGTWQPAKSAEVARAPEPASTPALRRAAQLPRPSAPPRLARAREVNETGSVRSTEREQPRFPTGRWVEVTAPCSALQGSDYVPLTVGSTKATAGGATCRYNARRPEGVGWRVRATCSDGTSTWDSSISLRVNSGTLQWQGARGSALYKRCELAQAGGSRLAGAVAGKVVKD